MSSITGENNNRTAATLLIGLGGFFLLTQIFGWSLGTLWPLFVILPGLPFLYAAFNGGRRESGLIFPGLIITGTGLLLLYQSITGHWESWAYVWAIYPVLVGAGLRFNGTRTDNQSEIRTGRGMMTYGLMALAGLWLLFEVFIFGSLFGGLTGWLLPLAMLAGGWYLLRSKHDSAPSATTTTYKHKNLEVPDMPKRKNEADAEINGADYISPNLRRRIDEALAEDDVKHV
ncbi:MAG: hypothetical protein SF029_21060 [bacterium]|nr:hypothetical protein [bacterium]